MSLSGLFYGAFSIFLVITPPTVANQVSDEEFQALLQLRRHSETFANHARDLKNSTQESINAYTYDSREDQEFSQFSCGNKATPNPPISLLKSFLTQLSTLAVHQLVYTHFPLKDSTNGLMLRGLISLGLLEFFKLTTRNDH